MRQEEKGISVFLDIQEGDSSLSLRNSITLVIYYTIPSASGTSEFPAVTAGAVGGPG